MTMRVALKVARRTMTAFVEGDDIPYRESTLAESAAKFYRAPARAPRQPQLYRPRRRR